MALDRTFLPVVEAILFAADQPVTVERLSKILDVTSDEAWEVVDQIARRYAAEGYGIELAEAGGAFFFKTKPAHGKWIQKIVMGREIQLSKAAMEVLSVIAYKQPVTRAEIDALRGVDSTNPLKALLDKKLIRIVGRKDVPGKPIVYGTSRDFLRAFGLANLSQLPSIREIKEMEEDTQLKLLGDEHEHTTAENPG